MKNLMILLLKTCIEPPLDGVAYFVSTAAKRKMLLRGTLRQGTWYFLLSTARFVTEKPRQATRWECTWRASTTLCLNINGSRKYLLTCSVFLMEAKYKHTCMFDLYSDFSSFRSKQNLHDAWGIWWICWKPNTEISSGLVLLYLWARWPG